MNAIARLFPSLLLAATAAAHAQAADDRLSLGYARTDYSGVYGERELATLEWYRRSDGNTVVLQALAGERRYGTGEDFNGHALAASFQRDWAPRLSTRTALTLGSDDPLFVRRMLDQELTFKVLGQATLSLGARHARYYGDASSSAWYLAGAWYFPRLSARYRYARYSQGQAGGSDGHLLMLRLRDANGEGATQLWLGRGDTVREYEWSPLALRGDVRSASLRRLQPLTPRLALDLRVERTWYETPVADYEGDTVALGLVWHW